MVFPSSFANYLDHQHNPTNWQQLQQSTTASHQVSGGIQNSQQVELPPPPPSQQGGGGGGPIRPGSMVDRARLANVSQPEAGLKCPRCDSTNTKFCYFNNYSLTQPRHFCKTCRRYWTRGGALRNVPVGGGCRRNKRSKSNTATNNSTKPQLPHEHNQNKSTNGSPSSCSTEITNHITQMPSQLPFMPTLQSLSQYNIGGSLGTNSISTFPPQGFQNIGSGNNNPLLPFLANFETPSNLSFPYQNGNSGLGSQVKMEENRGLDFSKLMGMNSENNQYWGGINANTWSNADNYLGINSSSTTDLV